MSPWKASYRSKLQGPKVSWDFFRVSCTCEHASLPCERTISWYLRLCVVTLYLISWRVPWICYMQEYSNFILSDQMHHKGWSYTTSTQVLDNCSTSLKSCPVPLEILQSTTMLNLQFIFLLDKAIVYDSHVGSDITIPHQFWRKITIFSRDNATCHAIIA